MNKIHIYFYIFFFFALFLCHSFDATNREAFENNQLTRCTCTDLMIYLNQQTIFISFHSVLRVSFGFLLWNNYGKITNWMWREGWFTYHNMHSMHQIKWWKVKEIWFWKQITGSNIHASMWYKDTFWSFD